jgi:DNA-binding MarR family transcriptional regulator
MTSQTSRTPSGTEAPAVALISGLERLTRAQREAAARVALQLDWPRAGIAVLRILTRYGPVSLTDIAARLRVDLSVASRQVTTLADAGYVARTVDAEDRRVRTVELTGAGRALAAEASEQYTSLIDRAFTAWSPEDLAEATRTLDRLADSITADTAHQRSIQNEQECA